MFYLAQAFRIIRKKKTKNDHKQFYFSVKVWSLILHLSKHRQNS